MLFLIVAYITIFALLGFYIFRGTYEGCTYFATIDDSLFNLLVLLTTANFPDIMLPAYYLSSWYCIYFIGYLVFGLFFLLNLLLAVFYSNYKQMLEKHIQSRDQSRFDFLEAQFQECDRN